ncbi:MAG: GAF and ANTAR domain-containing protein [Actinomycetota bacterium]|nr:GAF and ANTAR domain-containing protein [Actinomycetota bacterium]
MNSLRETTHSAPDVAPALAELTALLLSDTRIEELLGQLAGLAADGLAGVEACGVTMDLDGRPHTVASTSAQAAGVDEVQYNGNSGPCVEALRTGTTVTVSDCRADDRWKGFGDAAADLGIHCVLSLPLFLGDRVVGVLNLYGGAPHDFDEAEVRRGQLFAAQGALVLAAAARHSDQVELTQHLQAALTSRAVIDQAIGVTMAHQQCGPVEGFERLRRISQDRNVKLRLIAAEVVAAAQLPKQAAASR